MAEELNLVADLAVILIAAGIFTVISKALKQPLILGYIIAGFIVSPHLGLLPAISSTESVHQWSEIGIIFLLFALGLEFSFKKLLKVGSSALITAGTICIGMFITGMVAGNIFGWARMESLFLGGLLSMSSTTVIIKAYDDMGLKNKPYAPLIFGTLVVEDLIAVVMMVLLSTLAVSKQFSGTQMLVNLARLAFFLILWFLVGLYVIPIVLKKARKYLTDEILLIISIGLCFGMVALASFAGFSSALGAFVMGSILAETVEGERISHLLTGIKNLFGAIFFVSVGMMIDPVVIGEHWGVILAIAVIAVAGILLFSTTGSLLAGQGLDNSVHVGFTMAQLGEFSFIIASLGCSLGFMRPFIYPVIIAVSVITTFTAPYMIKAGDPASKWLAARLPASILDRINPQQGETSRKSTAEKNEWAGLLKSYILRVVLYGVVLVAILLASRFLLGNLAGKLLPFLGEDMRKLLCLLITLALMLPFLYGLAVTNGSINAHASKLLSESASNRWPILSMMIFRILIAIGFILAAITSYFRLGGWGIVAVIVSGLLFFMITKRTFRNISGLEKRFMENFNAREEQERRAKPVASTVRDTLSEYDIHTQTIQVSPDFAFAGKSLREMPFRRNSGINIIKIQRGTHSIQIPSGEEPIFPYDKIIAVGTSAQLQAFEQIMNEHTESDPGSSEPDFCLIDAVLQKDSYLSGKTLREVEMRKSGCMIISVLHSGKLITNPGADFRFSEGDTVWIAGEESSCKWFIQ